jgi:peroxiredoxin
MRLLQWTVLLATILFTSQAFAIKDFAFKDINGNQHKLSDYQKDGKWTLVNYWGVSCAPCRAEVPELNNVVRKHGKKVTVLGIELMSSTDSQIRKFMNSNGMRFTVAGTQSSVINPLGTIRRLPTTFIISPEGQLVKTHQGVLTEKDVKGYLATSKSSSKKTEAKPAAVPEAKPEKQAEVKPAPAPEKKQVAKVEKQAEPKVEAKPAPAPKVEAKKKDASHDILMGINADDFF